MVSLTVVNLRLGDVKYKYKEIIQSILNCIIELNYSHQLFPFFRISFCDKRNNANNDWCWIMNTKLGVIERSKLFNKYWIV